MFKRLLIAVSLLALVGCGGDEERLKMKRDISNLREKLYEIEGNQNVLRNELKAAVDELKTQVSDRTQEAEMSEDMRAVQSTLSSYEARLNDLESRIARLNAAQTMVPTGTTADNSGEQGETAADSVAGSDIEKLFRQAMIDFNRGKYDVAVLGFEDLVRQFPNSPFEEASLYYLGRSHFEQKNWSKAVEIFEGVRDKYPSGEYTAQATYYLGHSFYKSGLMAKSVLMMRQVGERFPGTQEAELAEKMLEQWGFSR